MATKRKRLAKGSAAARRHMARLRAMQKRGGNRPGTAKRRKRAERRKTTTINRKAGTMAKKRSSVRRRVRRATRPARKAVRRTARGAAIAYRRSGAKGMIDGIFPLAERAVYDAMAVTGGRIGARMVSRVLNLGPQTMLSGVAEGAAGIVMAMVLNRWNPDVARMAAAGALSGAMERTVRSMGIPYISNALGDPYYDIGDTPVFDRRWAPGGYADGVGDDELLEVAGALAPGSEYEGGMYDGQMEELGAYTGGAANVPSAWG